MSRALLQQIRQGIVVFDIDGVLACYEFGPDGHTADVWEEAFVSREDNPYVHIHPLPVLQKFIREMNPEDVYVLSVGSPFEQQAKSDFVIRNYPIQSDHILFVPHKKDKGSCLQEIAAEHPGKTIALVDDSVDTLDQVYQLGGIRTVHITSYFDEPTGAC